MIYEISAQSSLSKKEISEKNNFITKVNVKVINYHLTAQTIAQRNDSIDNVTWSCN